MRKHTQWLVIACAGLSLSALPAYVQAADPAAPGRSVDARDTAAPLAFPIGFMATKGAPADGIKSGLGKLVERAVTKGDFNSMLGELAKPERENARAFKGVDQTKLDGQIERLHVAWKAKYGKDFSLDAKVIFGAPLEIIEGEVSDATAAVADWPVPAMPDLAINASSKQPPGNKSELKKDEKETKLEKGRHVALVRFPAMENRPPLTVSMIHYLPAFWRVDVPTDRSGEQIYNDVLTQITWLADTSAQWPADVNQAYREVAYHVTAAVYGVNPTANHPKG
jgi:hypothetical protein